MNENRLIWLGISYLVIMGATSSGASSPDLAPGVAALQERRWKDAMKVFVDTLAEDPQNAQAHTYLDLVMREMQSEHHAITQEDRLNVLSGTAKRLEDNWMDAKTVEDAILDTTQADEHRRQERWKALCDEADVEFQLGHLLAAHDLVFRVLAENPNQIQAQQLLSDLQSRVRGVLQGSGIPSEEKYALEGFYAYGQADYVTALTAWQKGLILIQQSYPADEAAHHLTAMHFEPYRKIAQAHVDEDRALVETQTLFRQATELYQKGRYLEALQGFRQVAILNPEYPQLGNYLAETEVAVEKDRAQRLGKEKQKEIARLCEKGLSALQQTQYLEAEQAFQHVLALDPTHPQARSYLSLVQAEIHRRHDPKAAQQHYEAGLVAYASGKLEEAIREWTIATRMDPSHLKAINALTKVQKELALNHEALP